jgi:hypothetical protein
MNTRFITCPVCGARIALPDYWTGTITCARCLNPIQPPMTRELPDEPLPVIPLDSQTRGDFAASVAALVVLVVGLLAGLVMLATREDNVQFAGSLVVAVVTLGLGLYVGWAATQRRLRPVVPARPPSKVLEYESRFAGKEPRKLPTAARDAWILGKFLLGLAAGIGAGLLLVSQKIPAMVILIPCVGFVCLFARGWRSLGLGLLLSLPLGATIFLCMCFGIIRWK